MSRSAKWSVSGFALLTIAFWGLLVQPWRGPANVFAFAALTVVSSALIVYVGVLASALMNPHDAPSGDAP